jgi:hypothetical protein
MAENINATTSGPQPRRQGDRLGPSFTRVPDGNRKSLRQPRRNRRPPRNSRTSDDRGDQRRWPSKPVPDFTPLHLTVQNQDGIEALAPNLRSRSTLDGRASCTIPITAGERGGQWSIEVNAPIAESRQGITVNVAPPERQSGSDNEAGA